MDKRRTYVLVIALLLIVFTIAGTSFAIFNYVRKGTTSTTIQSGDIEFSFIEGDSITLENAFPLSDEIGAQDTANVYEFKVNLSTTSSKIVGNYNVSLVSNNDGTNNFVNNEIRYNLEKNGQYVIGSSTSGYLLSSISGFDAGAKTGIGVIMANQEIRSGVTDTYKLRIWIDKNTDYTGVADSNGTMTGTKNNYTYSVKVKVSSTALNQQGYSDIDVKIDNKKITADVKDEQGIIAYALKKNNKVPTDAEWVTINDNTTANASSVRRVATTSILKEKQIVLEVSEYNIYYLFIKNKIGTITVKTISVLPETVGYITANSLLEAIASYDQSGYLYVTVNGTTYSIHIYNYEDNQTWVEDMEFGDSDDVGTSSTNAKNMVVVRVDGNLTIDEGVTVKPYSTNYGGPKGLLLYVTGKLTNNGTIDNSHGAKAEGQDVYLWKNTNGLYEYIPAIGANGGTSVKRSTDGCTTGIIGDGGITISERSLGGGGSGAACSYNNATTYSGAGGAATSYSGGTGGGGSASRYTNNLTAISGSSIGGLGGSGKASTNNSTTYAGAGGAGNPGGNGNKNGTTTTAGSGKNGTGGLLVIYGANIENNGPITALGSQGGDLGVHARGGSSGGGSINIFYAINFQSNNNILVDGGSSVVNGGTGGTGTYTIGSIVNGNFIKD